MSYTCGVWAFGQILDRYATDGYGPAVSTLDAIAAAGATGRLSGVDLNYPWSSPDIADKDVQAALETHGLTARCITPVIYGRRFVRGSFTNPDPALRAEAIAISHASVEVAKLLGADYVKFWPGQDGYDYPFQVDYSQLRRLSIDGIGGIARDHPGTRFGIEYKLKEPRTRIFWSTATTSLLALDDMGVDNVGLVMDFGHSLFAKENPSDALTLIHERGRLVDVELCDNYREWDDDLTVGALHVIETFEFLHTVDQLGWNEPLKLDLFPYREDAVRAVQDSLDTIDLLRDRVKRLPLDELNAARASHDALAAQRIVQRALFG
ncbi:MAG TPA: sugar phosphate isomerase/epimerase [Micromonosporaceae bacterium]|nr:sugar phosphate isomerase/epimerase [Micromonosporaceae bacterium]